MSVQNSCRFVGRLGTDPEVKVLAGGTSKVSARIAVNEYRKGADGERQEETTWVNLVWFGKSADTVATILHKGDLVAVESRLNVYQYENEAGEKQYYTSFTVDGWQKLSGRTSAETEEEETSATPFPF